jgi:hypothetical protein
MLRVPTERGSLAQLLRVPGVGRVARHAHVRHPARGDLDQEEGVERPEEQVGEREEVGGPDPRLPLPEAAEELAMPAQDGVGLDDEQSLAPGA